jgi:hypothetical protein
MDIGRKKSLKEAENPKLMKEIMHPAKIASLSSRKSVVVAVKVPLLLLAGRNLA